MRKKLLKEKDGITLNTSAGTCSKITAKPKARYIPQSWSSTPYLKGLNIRLSSVLFWFIDSDNLLEKFSHKCQRISAIVYWLTELYHM